MFKPFAVVAVVVAGLALAPLSLFAQTSANTRIGTWKLNLAKSKFEHGPAPQSEVRTFTVFQGDGISADFTLVNAAGQTVKTTYSVRYDGKDYPYVFDDGLPAAPEFASQAHAAAPLTAAPRDNDFGPRRSIVLVLPSDLDRDDRPELDSDRDGTPELDGNRDGTYSDDAVDVAALWDDSLNTIHPDTGLVWSHAEVSYVVVVLADGSRVLQRRVDNDVATARVIARHVERVQFDTSESSGWAIPLDAVRVRIFFRATDEGGRLYRARNEVTVRLRNG